MELKQLQVIKHGIQRQYTNRWRTAVERVKDAKGERTTRARQLLKARRHGLKRVIKKMKWANARVTSCYPPGCQSIAHFQSPYLHWCDYDKQELRRMEEKAEAFRSNWPEYKAGIAQELNANILCLEMNPDVTLTPEGFSWIIENITLDSPEEGVFGVEIGDVRVTVEYAGRIHAQNLTCDLDNTRGYHHPHIGSDGHICYGDGSIMIAECLQSGGYVTLIDVIDSILRTYNRESPYIRLCDWGEEDENHFTCENCGHRVSDDDVYFVGDDPFCENCCTFCDTCQESVSNDDWDSEWEMCDYCVSRETSECEDCGERVRNDYIRFHNRMHICDGCYDKRIEEDEREEEEDDDIENIAAGPMAVKLAC